MRFVSFRLLRSLTARLLCIFLAALILTACATAGIVWYDSRQDDGQSSQVQLRKVNEMIQRNLRFDSAKVPGIAVSLPPDLSRVFHEFATDAKFRILDRSGGVIITSDNDSGALAPTGQAFDSTLGSFTIVSGGGTLFVRTEPMMHGAQLYYIQVAFTKRFSALVWAVSARLRFVNTLRFALTSAILVTVAVFFTVRRVLKPLRETSAAAARIDAHNISQRLSTRNLPIEFLPVVEGFNLTLDRLEKGYIVQRAFLASAAHELKTPLALIRAQIDLDGAPNREVLLHDLDIMARQVNQLLHLAEASETRNYVFEPVDLATVAEDVADYLRRLAERRQVYVDIRSSPGVAVLQADRGALFMLLKNLLENAVQHSPVGAPVVMTIDTKHLSVRDEGPGIAADELPKLFTRFWRGPLRRNEGAGLGLSICREIAVAHAWQLTALDTGNGAEFVVSFA
ncbi:MAG TPA: ATP-binding protein [Steroidobacteraceae bacterium]|nr:ATP-binding protein [Steroidobacteraceae bacterium]